MAVDKKISQLTSLAQVDVSASTDVLPIVDTSATETKKITVSALVGAGATAGISGAVLTNGTINSTTIGATTPSTGAFTTLSASSTVSGTGFSTYLASPPAIGSTAANTGAFTTLTTSSTVTLNGGTANGVLYLNGSKVATSGSALTFDGTTLTSSALTVSGASTLGGSTDKIIINRLSDATAYGSVTFNGLLASTTMTGLYGRGSGGDSGSLFYTVATGTNHVWQIAGSEQMRLNSTGLGIGTTSPATKLQVEAAAARCDTRISRNQSSGEIGTLQFAALDSGSAAQVYTQIISGITSATAGAEQGYLAFETVNAGAVAERMRLDTSGNLALGGTTNKVTGLAGGGNGLTIQGATAPTLGLYDTTNAGYYLNLSQIEADSYLWNIANGFLSFGTNNTERARITAGGYFKASNDGTYVGSTANYHEFRSSNNTYAVYITNTNASPLGTVIEYNNASPNGTGNVFLFCGDSTATRATIRSNGGLANYQANDVNLSDQRVKKDIKPLGSMWDKFKAIEIVTFKYNDQTHDDDNIGVIAQQVESVAPEFIDTDGFGETPEGEEPLKTVYTTDMYHAAIKALQEAMARIEKLEAEVTAMKGVA
jgi:hypothetical protein